MPNIGTLDDFFIARRQPPDEDGCLRLGVSGFRCTDETGKALMRTCMEFRNRPDGPLEARVRWTFTGFNAETRAPGGRDWSTAREQLFPEFKERHLTADLKIPPGQPTGDRAIVVQWIVKDGGTTYVGPLSVLRL